MDFELIFVREWKRCGRAFLLRVSNHDRGVVVDHQHRPACAVEQRRPGDQRRDRVDRAERARLDVERARSRRLGRNLSTVIELIGTGCQAPRRTETVDEYARNYTSGVGSVYFR